MKNQSAVQAFAGDALNSMEEIQREPTVCSSDHTLHSISVVLPAFNEAENIEHSVDRAYSALSHYFNDLEIIVVDDGSEDETGSIIDRLASERDYVVALHHGINRGYGATLRTGIERSRKDLIFFTDADLQFDFDEVLGLMDWVDEYEIVAGYRARRADPWHRKFNAWGWNRLVRVVLGLKVKDIDCAFKLFHRHVFESVPLESVGAMINTEILAKANHQGMRIKEVPVSHFKRRSGVQSGAKIRVILKALRELSKMRQKLKIPAHKRI